MSNRSIFPSGGIDTFPELVDLSPEQVGYAEELKTLLGITNRTEAQISRINELLILLKDNFISAEVWNKLCDCIVNVETTYLESLTNVNSAIENANNATANAIAATSLITNEIIIIYVPFVATYSDIATTYPTPQIGWTTQTQDTHIRYRWNGTLWVDIGVFTDDNVGDMSTLTTTAKDYVVNSINEINSKVGDTTNLATSNKTNLVNGVNSHVVDYITHPANGGTTGGTSTAYTVTTDPLPSSLVDKIGVVFTCHVDSGTSPTLQWGTLEAKPIVKPNGSAGVLKQNGIYTVRYNATTQNFQLQGEGGEYGTVTASDVRNTKTLGTENGVVQGTLDLSLLTSSVLKKDVTIDGVTGDKLIYGVGDYVPAPQIVQDQVLVTPAGTSSTSMQCGLIDEDGNFYIYHYTNSISKFDVNGVLQWTCTGTGTPGDWCFDESGNVLYTNSTSIFKINKDTGVKSTYMSAVTSNGSLYGIIRSQGYIYVTDGGGTNGKVNLIKISGTTKVGTYAITNQTSGTYYGKGICADNDGNVYVSASYGDYIYRLPYGGSVASQWASMLDTNTKGLTYDSVNNCIYAASGVLSKFAMDGTLIWQKTSTYNAGRVIADNHGYLYVDHQASSTTLAEVVKLDTDGNEIFRYRTFFDYSVSSSMIAINNNGYVVVHDSNYVVAKVYMGVKIVS